MSATTDPLNDAIEVLGHVKLDVLSAVQDPVRVADVEDAANRVALAIGYLKLAQERLAEGADPGVR